MSGESVPLNALENQVGQLLAGSNPERFDAALRTIAGSFAAATGTLHRADVGTQQLHLVAHLGLPEFLIAITKLIPFGKGIAGQCAVQLQPITICNLQTDDSGVAKPSAKKTGVEGAIAVPVLGPDGVLVGVLGVGKIEEHTYTDDEQQVLEACAAHIGKALTN